MPHHDPSGRADPGELLAVGGQGGDGLVVALVDDAPDLAVDELPRGRRDAVERRCRHSKHREGEEQHDRGQSAEERHALPRAHRVVHGPLPQGSYAAGLPEVGRG